MGETDKNIKPNSLEDSLMEMRNQLAERAKELTSLQKTVSFSVPSYAIKALQQYQENMADIQEHIAPYSRMMTEAIRQWDKQREMIMPVIEKIAEPMRVVQEAISKYPKMEADTLRLTPGSFSILPKETMPPRINEKDLLAKIKKLENKVDELLAKDKQEPKTAGKYKIYQTIDGVELRFNKENGNVELGDVKGKLSPGTNEFKVFVCLLESSSYVAKYVTLMQLIYPGKEFRTLKFSQPERWALTDALKKVKRALGSLPKKGSKNKDIVKVMPKEKAYCLELKD